MASLKRITIVHVAVSLVIYPTFLTASDKVTCTSQFGLIADPDDCTKYYECVFYYATSKTCSPSGYGFDEALGQCTSSGCSTGTTETTLKQVVNVQTKGVNKSNAEYACGPEGHLIDLRSPHIDSMANLLYAYIKSGLLSLKEQWWTEASRNASILTSPDGLIWYWSDYSRLNQTILDNYHFVEYAATVEWDCSVMKYPVNIDRWIFKAQNCTEEHQMMCAIETDIPCSYASLGYIRVNQSNTNHVRLSTVNSTSRESCEDICDSWIHNNNNECWLLSFNPTTCECEIIERDVMPNDYEICDWFVADDVWVSLRRVCYEINVFDLNGVRIPYPPCEFLVSTTAVTTITTTTTTEVTVESNAQFKAVLSLQNIDAQSSVSTSQTMQSTLSTKQDTTTPLVKRIFNLRKGPLNQSEAEKECQPEGVLFDLRSPATDSILNLLFAYISTGLFTKTDRVWTGATRGVDPTLQTWYWTDMEHVTSDILNHFNYLEFIDRLHVNCSSVKYNPNIKGWRFVADNCYQTRAFMCEITTDKPCDYDRLGGFRMNSTLLDISTTSSASFQSCQDDCESWILNNINECWFFSFNPTTYECEVIENDVMPSDYESCDWFIKDDLWITGRRVCYELNVYDVNGILLNYATCNFSTTTPFSLTSTTMATSEITSNDIEISTEFKTPSLFTRKQAGPELEDTVSPFTEIGRSTEPDRLVMISRETSPGIQQLTKTTTCVKYCRCNVGSNQIRDKFIAEILDMLKIDQKKTSSYRRLFTSAPDDRPLSVGLGWTGIALLIFVGTGIFVLDCERLYRDIQTIFISTKHVFRSSIE